MDPASSHARAVIEQAERLLASAARLGSRAEDIGRSIRLAYAELQRQYVRREMNGLSVDALSTATAADRASVHGRGIRTVGQLLDVGKPTTSAERNAGRAARALAQSRMRTSRPALSAEDPSKETTHLLGLLRDYLTTQEVLARRVADKPVSFYVDRMSADDKLPRLLAFARGAGIGSPMGYYFAAEEKRELGAKALDRLTRIVESGDAACIFDAEVRIERDLLDPRADFRRRAALYQSALEGLLPTDEESRAFRGDIDERLAEEVARQPLGTVDITVPLRGYQVFGAQFVLSQRRVLLGDEMGLGKTMQALAAAAHLQSESAGLVLIVCPASLILNWRSEIMDKTTLTAHVLHGTPEVRERAMREWLAVGQLAITSYETLHNLPLPDDLSLQLIVADEAHYVKNPSARRTKTLRSVAAQADRVLLMTGTPLENNLGEFQSLIRTVDPAIARRLTVSAAPDPASLKRAVAPVYLRRNQRQVLRDLPEQIDHLELVEFSSGDLHRYREAVREGNYQLLRRAAYLAEDSAKLHRLGEIVREACDNGEHVLVFSYFLDVLQTAARHVGHRHAGTIRGNVSFKDRDQIVRDFNRRRNPGVLTLQIMAGGVGLNLQAASTVILCEPQFKPSTEVQAIARSRRMGQVNSVQVHRLVVQDSVDRLIMERLDHKQRVFDTFVRDSQAANDERAIDGSEIDFQKWVVEYERKRLGIAA